jgi:hypothetical protein
MIPALGDLPAGLLLAVMPRWEGPWLPLNVQYHGDTLHDQLPDQFWLFLPLPSLIQLDCRQMARPLTNPMAGVVEGCKALLGKSDPPGALL